MRIDPADVAICLADEGLDEGPGPAPTATPVVQTSLFTFPTFEAFLGAIAEEHRNPVYTRGQNPTVEAVERKIAALEGGERAKCFASGMGAVSAVMLALLRSGDHVLFVNQTYGPTLQLARHLRRFGIEHDVTLDLDPASVERALRPETRLVWLESPGTMTFRVADVAAIAGVAREAGALTCMDNSWATPLLQKPLRAGADLVVHSATKYLAGHSDVVAGAVVSTEELMREVFYRAFLLNGAALGPFDAWLLLRGLRTLPVRLRQHEADALEVATFLEGHPAVARVNHPALGDDAELAERRLGGWSGLFSFELARDDFDAVRTVIDALERFRIGVSWGGVESLVLSPRNAVNAERLREKGIPPSLIRLSIGLEGADVLIRDLERALGRLA